MDTPQLGKLIDGPELRDAVHIPIAPVRAAHKLKPGQHVGFIENDSTELVGESFDLIGIVDPYLTKDVEKGQRFWLCLYPGTVTSMKHVWQSAAFSNAINNATRKVMGHA